MIHALTHLVLSRSGIKKFTTYYMIHKSLLKGNATVSYSYDSDAFDNLKMTIIEIFKTPFPNLASLCYHRLVPLLCN